MASTTIFALGFQIDSALQIRIATAPFEISQLRAVLDAEHYLKAGRPAGHVIWQGVYEHYPEDSSENLVAVLCWAGAAKRLKDRDTWIGWDAVTCANRLKLVVQLRRFVIPQEARRPNLASQCLGLALNCKTLRSLKDAFKQVDDPRNPCNRRHPLSALLGMITYGLLCGAPDVKAMWAKCGPLNQHQRAAIGLTRRDPKSGLYHLA